MWSKWIAVKLFLAVTLVVVCMLLAPIPYFGPVHSSFQNLAHAPVFAILGAAGFLAICAWWPGYHYLLAASWWVALSFLGVATEVGQKFVGRLMSLEDAAANAFGAAAGIFVILAIGRPNRRAWLLTASVCCLTAGMFYPVFHMADTVHAAWQMPVLGSFETQLEMGRWHGWRSNIKRTADRSAPGRHCLRVVAPHGEAHGVTLVPRVQNWSGYRGIEFDLTVEEGEPRAYGIRLGSRRYHVSPIEHMEVKRSTQMLALAPGKYHLRFPFNEATGAPIHLREVEYFTVFLITPLGKSTWHLDQVTLF